MRAAYRLVRLFREGDLYHDFEGVYWDTFVYQRDIVDMRVLRHQSYYLIHYAFIMHREFLGYPYGGDVVVSDIHLDRRAPSGTVERTFR